MMGARFVCDVICENVQHLCWISWSIVVRYFLLPQHYVLSVENSKTWVLIGRGIMIFDKYHICFFIQHSFAYYVIYHSLVKLIAPSRSCYPACFHLESYGFFLLLFCIEMGYLYNLEAHGFLEISLKQTKRKEWFTYTLIHEGVSDARCNK